MFDVYKYKPTSSAHLQSDMKSFKRRGGKGNGKATSPPSPSDESSSSYGNVSSSSDEIDTERRQEFLDRWVFIVHIA